MPTEVPRTSDGGRQKEEEERNIHGIPVAMKCASAEQMTRMSGKEDCDECPLGSQGHPVGREKRLSRQGGGGKKPKREKLSGSERKALVEEHDRRKRGQSSLEMPRHLR